MGIGGTIFIDENDNGFFDPNESNLGEQSLTTVIELREADGTLTSK